MVWILQYVKQSVRKQLWSSRKYFGFDFQGHNCQSDFDSNIKVCVEFFKMQAFCVWAFGCWAYDDNSWNHDFLFIVCRVWSE